MPSFLMHVGATFQCMHAGPASVIPTNTRVFVDKQLAATVEDTFPVTGCAFMVGTKPQPCVLIRFIVPATRVFINKQPAILSTSTGLCFSAEQIPQGAPTIVRTQLKVMGT